MSLTSRFFRPLKPETRLAQAVCEYEAILQASEKAVFYSLRSDRPPGLSDVMETTAAVDRNIQSRRCFGPRLISILESVQQVSTIDDAVVRSSRYTLASAVWSVLRTTLLITSTFGAYFDRLSALFMRIGIHCPRYQEYGLLDSRSPPIQDALSEYFCAIVNLCTKAVLFLRKPPIAQLTSTILNSFQAQFGPLEAQIANLAGSYGEAASLETQKELRDESKTAWGFRNPFSDLQVLRQKKLRFLDACSTFDQYKSWKRAQKLGKCSWIFDEPAYEQWTQESSSTVLWCTGGLGSGKTVSTANIVRQLHIDNPEAIIIGFFFCSYDDANSLKARTILGSLARQLLRETRLKAFDSIEIDGSKTLDEDEIISNLVLLLASTSCTYFAVVDGIDDCAERELCRLLRSLHTLLHSIHPFRIFCSSRPDTKCRYRAILQPQHELSLFYPKHEIDSYIDNALEERLELGNLALDDPSIILKIRKALLEGSKGMFLWTALQLDSICAEASDQGILTALQSLPKDLPCTFERILQKLSEKGSEFVQIARKTFTLVAAAQRPLTVQELREAVSILPGDTRGPGLPSDMRSVLDKCGGLLVVDEEDDTVRFAHPSVRQYLTSTSEDAMTNYFHVDLHEADVTMGEICVTYLNSSFFQTGEATSDSRGWIKPSATASTIVHRALPSTTAAKHSQTLLKPNRKPDFDAEPYLERAYGYAIPERELWTHAFFPYAREFWLFHTKSFEEKQVSYPLWLQLIYDHTQGVTLPFAPEVWSRLGLDESLLEWTVENGHGALLYLIIERLKKYSEVERVWQVLLAKGVYLALDGLHGSATLQRAVSSITAEMVPELLERSTNLDPRSAPLWWAAQQSDELFRVVLRQENRRVNSTDPGGRSALSWAAQTGRRDIVVQLLEQDDINANLSDENGRTPLSFAVENFDSQVATLLLMRPDIDFNAQDRYGRTALSRAADCGNQNVVKLLLDHDSTVAESRDLDGRTPLSWAASKGHEATARLLIFNGAKVDSVDRLGQSPLSWAVEYGHYNIAKLLVLEGKANPHLEDYRGRTPLLLAVENGHAEIVEVFLEAHKANTTSLSDHDKELLMLTAIRAGHQAIIQLLLHEWGTPDSSGATALQTALSYGHTDISKFLLAQYSDWVAEEKFEWIGALIDARFEPDDSLALLLETESPEPWIKYGLPDTETMELVSIDAKERVDFHHVSCAHKESSGGGFAYDQLANPATFHMRRELVQRVIAACCGLAGVLPPSRYLDCPPNHIVRNLQAPPKHPGRPLEDANEAFGQVEFEGNEATIVYARSYEWAETSRKHSNADSMDYTHWFRKQVGLLDYRLRRNIIRLKGQTDHPWSYPQLTAHLSRAVERLRTAANLLQSAGFCCNSFTILCESDFSVEDTLGNSVIRMATVSFETLKSLMTSMADMNDSELEKASIGLGNATSTCVDVLRGCLGGQYPNIRTAGQKLHTCSLVVQMLSLALLSYAQGHTGELHPMFLKQPLTKIRLQGSLVGGISIFAELRPLACMRPMIGGDVLVFKIASRLQATPSASTSPAYLYATCAEIVDTWGPAHVIRSPESSDSMEIYGLMIGGGLIKSSHSLPTGLDLFHWYHDDEGLGAEPEPFSYQETILVGAVTVNPACPLDAQRSRRRSEKFLQDLGTARDTWIPHEIPLILQGGNFAVAQVGLTYQKLAGRTLKKELLDRWNAFEDIRLFDLPWGLQLSLCTGVARRVRLRDLIEEPVIRFIDSLHVDGWTALKPTALTGLRSNDFLQWCDGLKDDERVCLRSVFSKLLKLFEHTGFDTSGNNFGVLWPEESNPYLGIKISPVNSQLWYRMLKDSECCATFAIVTSLCLETSEHKCQKKRELLWHQGGTVLSTSVCPALPSLLPAIQTPANLSGWQLEHKEQYWIGRCGGEVWVRVRKEPNRATELQLMRRFRNFPFYLFRNQVLREKPDVNFHTEEVFVLTGS
ncbi:hypothetical protein AYO20_00915 [Fonsecaea nubica]|uniref:Uncharacterized protein n=1 Tax=Fonsecaea nubica TaxID=856822 RepID=A0A178DEB0_9EURO|nr:hypothetical protein AYO20_00915 [Fonsecaea nubica]OAL40002.1 hypothetical protein AYO20_00915 [Fonsecaea nubica]